jgi:hypothetical protein
MTLPLLLMTAHQLLRIPDPAKREEKKKTTTNTANTNAVPTTLPKEQHPLNHLQPPLLLQPLNQLPLPWAPRACINT